MTRKLSSQLSCLPPDLILSFPPLFLHIFSAQCSSDFIINFIKSVHSCQLLIGVFYLARRKSRSYYSPPFIAVCSHTIKSHTAFHAFLFIEAFQSTGQSSQFSHFIFFYSRFSTILALFPSRRFFRSVLIQQLCAREKAILTPSQRAESPIILVIFRCSL